jgi:SAM-dependent methyltransferase
MHETWATVYDRVYELSYGGIYGRLTDRTVAAIGRYVPAPASVIDFGAGTGRLALPLAKAGYRVTAIDASPAMLAELRRKAALAHLEIRPLGGRLQDRHDVACFDLSVCVFSVLSYLVSPEDLEHAFGTISRATALGGRALVDVPERVVFGDHGYVRPGLQREVSITPTGQDTYRYRESTRLETDDGPFAYADEFEIRWWAPDHVLRVAEAQGLLLDADPTNEFADTGARYFLLRRR